MENGDLFLMKLLQIYLKIVKREASGSAMVLCLTRDRGDAGSSLTSITKLCL